MEDLEASGWQCCCVCPISVVDGWTGRGKYLKGQQEAYEEHVPDFMRYPYIEGGYRRPNLSVGEYFWSVFSLHNETINIWTHLLGTVAVASILVWTLFLSEEFLAAEFEARAVTALYLCSVIVCWGCSTTAHTLSPLSSAWNRRLFYLDYFGIFLASVFCNLALGYFGFYCQQQLRWVNFVSVCVLVGVSAYIVFRPLFADSSLTESLSKETILFQVKIKNICLGLSMWSSILPLLYDSFTSMDPLQAYSTSGLAWWILGAIVFSTNIPERYIQRVFDIMGSSHQVMHFTTLFANYCFFLFLYTRLVAINGGNFECSR